MAPYRLRLKEYQSIMIKEYQSPVTDRWHPHAMHSRPFFLPQKIVRKVVGGFGEKGCISPGVRKPENTCMCVTDRLDKALAVKVALNPNTTNQPAFFFLPF